MRTLEEIDRDLEIAYADMRNFIHSGFSISPVLEDDIDELRDERAAVVKAIQDAGLMRYEVCILPKPENTSSYCAAFYKITATSQNQAFEHGKETFIRGFANCGVTAENFDAEYDIGVTRGGKDRMKAHVSNGCKPCPFCGAPVTVRLMKKGPDFIACTNKQECGAIVSFNNIPCDCFGASPVDYFNRRASDEQVSE